MENNTCCFIGHRTIEETEKLKFQLNSIIEMLIMKEHVNTFLFGSKSRFNDLCHELVSKSMQNYPFIKRVYVRAEYPNIDENYKRYLLNDYEETYYPDKIMGAGRAVYVERNYEMIRNSKYCVFYFKNEENSKSRKSGTKTALDFAFLQKKEIIILP